MQPNLALEKKKNEASWQSLITWKMKKKKNQKQEEEAGNGMKMVSATVSSIT